MDLIAIPECNGYFTDGFGNIFSTRRGGLHQMQPHDHYGNHSNQPYKRLTIEGKSQFVHRIVARVLVGRKLLDNEHVNHKDGNASNNALSNLEIVTHQENVQHATINKLYCHGRAWYAARGLSDPEGE